MLNTFILGRLFNRPCTKKFKEKQQRLKITKNRKAALGADVDDKERITTQCVTNHNRS